MLWSTAGSKEGAGHQVRPQWRSHVPHWHQVRGSHADSGGRAAQAEGRGSAKGRNTSQSHRSRRASVAQGSVKGKVWEPDGAQIRNYRAGGANRTVCQGPQQKRKNGVTEGPRFSVWVARCHRGHVQRRGSLGRAAWGQVQSVFWGPSRSRGQFSIQMMPTKRSQLTREPWGHMTY